MSHPLHRAVADVCRRQLKSDFELILDVACGGDQRVPLFVGPTQARETEMCCVDLLVLQDNRVRAIVEIEESGFEPTKTCGKFFQAVLANHYIHDDNSPRVVPYADKVLFIQVLDSSKFPASGSSKEAQAEQIEERIRSLLPLGRITDYRLVLIKGEDDEAGLDRFAQALRDGLGLAATGVQSGAAGTG